MPLWLFGYLQSAAFMAWVRAFAGRMKSDFSISPSTVYFTFPFVMPTAGAFARVDEATQAVLDAREAHPEESLSDLYDRLAMPLDLRKAHDRLDAVIDSLYRLKKPLSAAQRRRAASRRPIGIVSSVARGQRLLNCGFLRALWKPAFLRSTLRSSRVRKPARLSCVRRFSSASQSALAMPWRTAPACAEMPPPYTLTLTSNLPSVCVASKGIWAMVSRTLRPK